MPVAWRAVDQRSYVVRTFGCQMNEHDSERIAGLLEADGLVAAGDLDDADVVVLNTCCIRENADNKLYGNLGHLKTWKGRRDGRQIVVSGCLAQKDRDVVRRRAAHVDVVMGTHNVHRAAELLHVAGTDGPGDGDPRRRRPRRPRPVPVGPAGRARDVVQRVGHDPDRLRQQLRVLHRAGGPRRRDLPAVRRDRRRGPASSPPPASPRSRCSARTSTATAATCSWRPGATATPTARVRPLFADLLRAAGAVDGIRRVRFTSPHPKDMRPETFAAMAETPAVCPQLHYPLQAGSDRVLAAMHRGYTAARYLERLAEARRTVPDLAVSTDIIVGFPGETDDDFARTLEVAAEARFDDAFTFIFSPRPGTEAATMADRFVDPASPASASTACASSSSAARWPPTRRASGASRRCSSRARARRTRRSSRPARPSTASCTSRRRARCAPARTRPSRSPAPRRTTSRAASSSVVAEPAHRTRIPVAAL